MRMSDWSSDVCSSDLLAALDDAIDEVGVVHFLGRERPAREQHLLKLAQADRLDPGPHARPPADVAKRGLTEKRVVRRDQQIGAGRLIEVPAVAVTLGQIGRGAWWVRGCQYV